MRPEATFPAHLTFMLKREGVHLELLARLFDRVSPLELAAWVEAEPNGRYARRAGFLYEWLTKKTLPVANGVVGGNYVEALDPEEQLVATKGLPVASLARARQHARDQWLLPDRAPHADRPRGHSV
jgi:hypothetical protein